MSKFQTVTLYFISIQATANIGLSNLRRLGYDKAAGRVKRIVYQEGCSDRGEAQSREADIKKLSRTQKMTLIEAGKGLRAYYNGPRKQDHHSTIDDKHDEKGRGV